jgi:hypothetical protein
MSYITLETATGNALNLAAWEDTQMPAILFRTGGTALTFIDCGNGIFLTRFDVGDIFYVQFQLPHKYK